MFDLDADLTEDERAVRDTVHRFAVEVLRPVGQQLDRLEPKDAIADSSPLWDVFRRYRELGLDDVSTDPSLTPLQQARLRCIVGEELGWGDGGLAISLGAGGFPRMAARMTGRPDLLERFGGDDQIGCWCATEPDHGSDLIIYGSHIEDLPGEPNCIARLEGDEYVINGQKAAWVSNGTIAHATSLFCIVDNGEGKCGMASFLVPLDLPGVSRGAPLDKLGQRPLNQGEIFFDHVRIPKSYMVLPPEIMPLAMDIVICQANGGMSLTFAGVARAAFEMAVEYAKERIQGGVPIIEHQSVRGRLFEMFRKVQAATALSRRAVVYNTLNSPPRPELAVAAKVTSTQNAFEVASAALQIFGGNGLSREYPIEKLLRDARASMIEDGCNEILSLVAAQRF